MYGWTRDLWFDDTGLPWGMRSPNMPSVDSAIVYPGMCLLEGTNLSEGRGTTRPFEICGAPFIEPERLVKRLADFSTGGAVFRPLFFEPAFQKHAGKLCGGLQIHVTARKRIRPFKTGAAIIKAVYDLYPGKFKWKSPPYEYEMKKLPIDILAGSARLRSDLEAGVPLDTMEQVWKMGCRSFRRRVKKHFLYR